MIQEERNTNVSVTTRCFCCSVENINCKII